MSENGNQSGPGIVEADLFELVLGAFAERAKEGPGIEPGTITRPELQAHMGCSEGKARRVLERLVADGYLARVWTPREDGWGVTRARRGYRWIKGPLNLAEQNRPDDEQNQERE